MKMIKALLFTLVATLAVRAPGEYIFWQVDWTLTDSSADYASIAVLDADGNAVTVDSQPVYLLTADETPPSTQVYRDRDYPSEPTEATSSISSPYNSNGYKFAIEIYDNTGTKLASSDPVAFSDLPVWSGSMNPPMGVSTVWSPTTYTAVPEPATGMLFIAGALMLFRRKRNA